VNRHLWFASLAIDAKPIHDFGKAESFLARSIAKKDLENASLRHTEPILKAANDGVSLIADAYVQLRFEMAAR
jgi:hypothetical protein